MLSVLILLDYGDQPAASEGHHKSLTKLWKIKKALNILTEVTVGDLNDSYLLKHIPYKTKCFPSFLESYSDHLQLFRTLYKYYFLKVCCSYKTSLVLVA